MLMPTRWLANEGLPAPAPRPKLTEADLDRFEAERESAVSSYLEQRRAATCCDHACDQGRTCPTRLQPAEAATELGTDDDQSRAMPAREFAGLLALLLCGLAGWAWEANELITLIFGRGQ